jgi:hypothetical protein
MKPFAAAVMTVIFAASLFGQRQVAPHDFDQPSPHDTVIAGNQLKQTVTCESGTAVYVEGQENEVQVHGRCRFVRVQGNKNHVWIDQFTTVPVEGNDNMVFVSDPETRYSSRGNNNRFDKAKH